MSVAQLVETQLLRERITELTEANDALERERDAMQARAERAEAALRRSKRWLEGAEETFEASLDCGEDDHQATGECVRGDSYCERARHATWYRRDRRSPGGGERGGVMTVLTCGISHTDPRSEAIYRALREDAGQRTDGGCGRALDLTNHIQQAITYRCVECGRWLCRPCILRHFAETGDDQRAASSAEPSTVTTRTITIRCHCGRGVTIGPDPWCEGCVQSAATCDCVPATQGRGDA